MRELFQAFMENPMMAMGLVQQLGIPPEAPATDGISDDSATLLKKRLNQLASVMMKLNKPKRSSKINSYKIE